MKITGGPMWDGFRQAKGWRRLLGHAMVGPALMGMIVAPTVVIWMPVRIWTAPTVVWVAWAILVAVTLLVAFQFTAKILRLREIQIEEGCLLLGLVMAMAAGWLVV